jgi:hypothetical protein
MPVPVSRKHLKSLFLYGHWILCGFSNASSARVVNHRGAPETGLRTKTDAVDARLKQ